VSRRTWAQPEPEYTVELKVTDRATGKVKTLRVWRSLDVTVEQQPNYREPDIHDMLPLVNPEIISIGLSFTMVGLPDHDHDGMIFQLEESPDE
jgi:hypothetical protein